MVSGPTLSKKSQDYGKAIFIHSLRSITDSLYPGQNYTNLAHLLSESHDLGLNGHGQDPNRKDHVLALLYDLNPQASDPKTVEFSGHQFTEFQNFRESADSLGQVILLRGYLASEWIKTVGAKYRIDPEFFQRHLSFQSAPIHQSVFSLPSLPSSTRNIIRINVSTICYRDPTIAKGLSAPVRKELEADSMRRYLRQFSSAAKQGDSIVRGYTSLNDRFSVLEQDISICLERNGKGWIAVIWLDSGKDLTQSPSGPWLPIENSGDLEFSVFPVQQHLRCVPLKQMLQTSTEAKPTPSIPTHPHPIFQSASLLPFKYTQFLDHEIASRDTLFALADIFRFAAYSETQLLNLMAVVIEDVIRSRNNLEYATTDPIDTLLEYKTLLDRHLQRLQENLRTLRRRNKSDWPTYPASSDESPHPQRRKTATKSADRLEEDFAYLVSLSENLSAKCTEGMGMLMNSAVVADSKKNMQQTERMKKLTLLATLFIPLSFSTSIFGMNFSQFGQGHLSIWIWVAVTVPILVVAVVAYIWSPSEIAKKSLRSMKGVFKIRDEEKDSGDA